MSLPAWLWSRVPASLRSAAVPTARQNPRQMSDLRGGLPAVSWLGRFSHRYPDCGAGCLALHPEQLLLFAPLVQLLGDAHPTNQSVNVVIKVDPGFARNLVQRP